MEKTHSKSYSKKSFLRPSTSTHSIAIRRPLYNLRSSEYKDNSITIPFKTHPNPKLVSLKSDDTLPNKSRVIVNSDSQTISKIYPAVKPIRRKREEFESRLIFFYLFNNKLYLF